MNVELAEYTARVDGFLKRQIRRLRPVKRPRLVTVFDTSVATMNSGDDIIVEAVLRELHEAFPEHFLGRVATHDRIGLRSYRLVAESTACFIGGTNILNPRMLYSQLWRLHLMDLFFVSGLILVGTGWVGYGRKPTLLTGPVLRRLLHPTVIHSVRDEYTKQVLSSCGISNVANTGCVTMWGLTKEHVQAVPKGKGRTVVTAINSAKPSPSDRELVRILYHNYEKVFVWLQGLHDEYYARLLFGDRAHYVAGTLNAYDRLLATEQNIDFVGPRLHAGIRALQRGKRTIIVSIDNRATEISRDTGLPTIPRKAIAEELPMMIESEWPTNISMPWQNIELFRGQLKMLAAICFGEAVVD